MQLLQKTLEINTQSMDQLRHVMYRHVSTVRISDTFEQPEMATDLFEHDLKKLNVLRQRGSESFAKAEADLQKILMLEPTVTISDDQLKTWAKQGPTAQFTATYDTLKNCLNDSSSTYYPKDFSVFLQGSYKNDSNVYGDSDVDVVIRLDQTYYSDLSNLSEEEKRLYSAARSDAGYTLDQFKKDVTGWLVKRYGTDVQSGTKAIYIKGNGSRRNADVLVCCKHRRYTRFKSWDDQDYREGISFFNSGGTRIDNFPTQHSDNCTKKHQDSKGWFKHTVRIYKNLRNTMIEKKMIEDGLAPSYFLEGLLWNVPIDRFGGTEQQSFRDTLEWLWKADRSKFSCANDLYYLCHPTSLVTWRAEKCERFLSKAIDYWNAA